MIDAMIAESRRRLHKMIDLRAELFIGQRKPSTVRRSLGQKYKRRKRED